MLNLIVLKSIHLCEGGNHMRRSIAIAIFLIIGLVNISYSMDWYVDNQANGVNNGTSWINAWENFSSINWATIQPGDSVYISGGESSQLYNEQLSIGASGTAGSPITIRVGQDGGHNGQVIITHTSYGINISGKSYITINGNYGGNKNIYVYDCGSDGIQVVGSTVNNIVLTYLEVGWNGNGGNEDGINIDVSSFSYPIIEISHCSIHDNYQDQIYSNRPDHGIRATDYGVMIVHHNDIYNLGDDGFQAASDGIDFYENTVHGRSIGGGRGHADGVQFIGGSYTRIYNNTFYDMAHGANDSNAYIFFDPYRADGISSSNRGVSNVEIYNNLVYETGKAASNEYLRGIAFKAENNINSISNILIANNIIVGTPAWGLMINLNRLRPDNFRVLNNILYDCSDDTGGDMLFINSGPFTTGSAGSGADLIIDYNHVGANAPGTTTDVNFEGVVRSYTSFKSMSGCQANDQTGNPNLDGNFKPNVGSSAIDAGISLSSYFTIDMEGTPRPQGFTWDIGAFEFTGGKLVQVPNAPSGLRIK